ncbi:hypothetical protein GQ53DRAFT_850160 [Thozetella sp. PMI_491]|nr:hypothetical protein GQ53DRAFT_850160 [Thozetella sp. PMI_491]
MPRIKSFAPGWLNSPAPGHKLFALAREENTAPNSVLAKKQKPGPRRTIARRGTEVFVAAGRQIRWGDLAILKENWESKTVGSRLRRENTDGSFEVYDDEAGGNIGSAEGYRIIKTPVADDIRQLVMSPQQDFLAVLTSHTVHICILPDSSHLSARDTAPFKPKFWTLGPTTHVTSRSAVVAALWHPLGVNGSTLVTVTEDALVRVWELSTSDRWTFDAPTVAVDLKRLADGTSLDQDFSATTATNKGFSPDEFDMEVAAACFPGPGSSGWSCMTLWVAMTGGDTYALCPLLPQRWAPPPTLIPSLSVSIVAKVAATEDDPDVSPQAKLLAQQQLEWLSDLDNQEPRIIESSLGDSPIEVYQRPSRPGIIPKLQGPFEFELNPEDEQDDEVELRDIYVIGEKLNVSDLMNGEDEDVYVDEYERDGLSVSVVCLLSTSGQVKLLLDLDGVEAQWLPPRNKTRRFALDDEQPCLLTFQTFDTMKPAELTPDAWPMFSDDITSRYAFYVTHPAGLTHVSLAGWVFRLESELQGASDAGAEFRMDLLVKGPVSAVERVYTQPTDMGLLAAATAVRDPDLGYFVLSATHQDPVALFFDMPEERFSPVRSASPTPQAAIEAPEPRQPLTFWEPRPLFHPSRALDRESALFDWHKHLKSSRRKPLLPQEVRLSIATLETFTEGHRVVSSEVHELNGAVAELFRKCEALQYELREQILKANEVKQRIESVTGEDAEEGEPVSADQQVKNRLLAAQQKQEALAKRMDALKRKLGRATSRELSDKEKAWMEEVRALDASVSGHSADPRGTAKGPWKRLDEVKRLRETLFAQAEQLQKKQVVDGAKDDAPASPGSGLRIPSEVKKAKVAQVMSLLDRETALVEALKSRVETLSLG